MQKTTFERISINVLGKIGFVFKFGFSPGRLLKFAQKCFFAFFGVCIQDFDKNVRFQQKPKILAKLQEMQKNTLSEFQLTSWGKLVLDSHSDFAQDVS